MNNFPKVNYVTFETDCKELGKVKHRRILVGEHKRILEAIETSGDPSIVLNTLVDVVDKCTFEKLNVASLPMYVVSWLYLKIFIASKGDINRSVFSCQNPVLKDKGTGRFEEIDGEQVEIKEQVWAPCGTNVNVNVPLSRGYIHYPEGFKETTVIQINEEAGIKLRQPNVEMYKKIRYGENASNADIENDFLYSSIESIYDGDRVMVPGQDFDFEGLVNYIETLDADVQEKINEFFATAPELMMELPVKCPKCNHTENVVLKGLDDFLS